ncbi:MAG: sigma-70 family RNA polymerase sigma factor [Thermoanaerobaculia bacterium]|nr:sigma-70 family RNA polymerase sigma factor [Thermoanaerobaculia bacterium]
MTTPPQEVTQLLLDWSEGDPKALAKLMPLVCDELRTLARRYLNREALGHTLQPTALVNEVYLRLHGRKRVQWKNRAHFFGFAAQTMRRILVDHARSQKTSKRGEGGHALPLDEAIDLAAHQQTDLVALDEALKILTEMDPRQAQIVDLRFFVGLTVEECAAVLGIGTATVKREWQLARLWLLREISGDPAAVLD